MSKNYKYQCLDCNLSHEVSFKSTLKILCQAISASHELSAIKHNRPKSWQLFFKNESNPVLNFLMEHGDPVNHQVCVINPKGQIFNALCQEICPDCKSGLDSLYYEPPFDPCHQKHLDYATKKGIYHGPSQ